MRRLAILLTLLTLTHCAAGTKRARTRIEDPSSAGMVAVPVEDLGDPEVVVFNRGGSALVVDLIGPVSTRLTIGPSETRAVSLPDGTYTVRVSGVGFPDEHVIAFERDHRYVIGTDTRLEVDDPRFAKVGFHCYEVQLPPNFLNCMRRAEDCAKDRAAKAEANIPTTACAYEPTVYFHRIQSKDRGLLILFTRDAQQCELVRADSIARHAGELVGPCERRP